MRLLLFLGAVSASLLSTVSAADRSTAPTGAITVGSGGDFSTIQAAIDSLSVDDTAAQSIYIFAGTYKEQVDIAARKSILTIYGQTTDTTSYTDNVVNIEFSCSQLDCASTNDATATVSNHAEGTKFYNVNIKNTYGKGSQAVALSAYAGSQGYYGVGLYGYQDTLLAQSGTQLYAKSMIQGATDFIFGQRVQAWIEGSDLRINGVGYITASGRSSDDSGYYVINNCDVAVDSSVTLSAGSTYLGRPWRNYARVIFQNTKLSDVVKAAGWSIWTTGDERTDQVEFAEFGNSGAGAGTGSRATFSEQLSAAVDITTVLGSDYADWVDAAYLS